MVQDFYFGIDTMAMKQWGYATPEAARANWEYWLSWERRSRLIPMQQVAGDHPAASGRSGECGGHRVYQCEGGEHQCTHPAPQVAFVRLSQRGPPAKYNPVSSWRAGSVSRKCAVMVAGKPVLVCVLNSSTADPKNGSASGSDGYEMFKKQGFGVFSTDLLRTGNA